MQNSIQVFPRQPRQTPKIEIPGDDERIIKGLLKKRMNLSPNYKIPKIILPNADLKGVNLSYSDLRGVNLEGADLEGADLREVNLEGADLGEVDLEGADLREANLREANLREVNLEGADLRGADLDYTSLAGAKINDETIFSLLTQFPNGDFATPYTLEQCISRSELILTKGANWENYLKELGEEDLNPENFGIQIKEFLKKATSSQLYTQLTDYADTKPEQITDDPEALSDYGRTLIKAVYLGSSLGRLSHHISSIARKLEDQENPNISSNSPYISQQNYIQLNRFTQQEGSTDISYGIMAGDLFNYQNCESVDSMTTAPHQNYTEGVLNEHISVWMLKDWEEKEFKKLSKYTPTEQTKILRTKFELIKTEYSNYLVKGDKASFEFNKKSAEYKTILNNLVSNIRSSYQAESIKIKPIGLAKDMYHAYYLTEYNTVIKICVYKSMTEEIRYIGKETSQQADLVLEEELQSTIKKLNQEYFTNITEINQTNENQLDIESLTKINTPTDLVNWIKSQLIRIDNIELDTDTYFSYSSILNGSNSVSTWLEIKGFVTGLEDRILANYNQHNKLPDLICNIIDYKIAELRREFINNNTLIPSTSDYDSEKKDQSIDYYIYDNFAKAGIIGGTTLGEGSNSHTDLILQKVDVIKNKDNTENKTTNPSLIIIDNEGQNLSVELNFSDPLSIREIQGEVKMSDLETLNPTLKIKILLQYQLNGYISVNNTPIKTRKELESANFSFLFGDNIRFHNSV